MKASQVRKLSELVRFIKDRLPLLGRFEECHVAGCHDRDITPITLEPFDPIDHNPMETKLCDGHLAWGKRRNEFAREMHEEIRICQEQTGQSATKCRKQVGMEHIDRVQELAVPQGRMRKDVLDGSIKEKRDSITLGEALEVDE